jgi:hypothetical protein
VLSEADLGGAVPGADAHGLLGLPDAVLDIAVTPDRGYCLSVRGVARELAVSLGLAFPDPAVRPVPGVDGAGWPVVVEEARGLTDFFGAPRAIVVALLSLLGLLAATWKQLVQGLAIGLTGREGLIKSSVLIRLSSLVLIGLIAHLLDVSRDARIFLWNAVPWIPAVPVFFKVCAAAWVATRLHRDRLLGDRALVTGARAL